MSNKEWPGDCPECGKKKVMLAQSVVCEDPECGKKVVEEWSRDDNTEPMGVMGTWNATDAGWYWDDQDHGDTD